MARMKLATGSVLGTFTKAVGNAVSVNHDYSGGPSCVASCRHHPNPDASVENPTYGCYAAALEHSFKGANVLAKLTRHGQLSPAQVIGKATVELQQLIGKKHTIPWVRFSTNGSVPNPDKADAFFIRQLRTFIVVALEHGAKIHFPVESADKAAFYREKIGDLVVIRESLQTVAAETSTMGPVSFVAGDDIVDGGQIYARRVEAAKQAAKRRKIATGRNTIVCPAVVSGFKRKTKNKVPAIKCGQCTACANPLIDVVYPKHK